MQVGRMRYRIEIQDYKSTQDADGFETREWMTVHTVWADIAPVSGKEYMASNRETAEITNKIYIRFRSGIKSTMRIKHGDRIFEIESVLGDKRSGMLTIMAREVARWQRQSLSSVIGQATKEPSESTGDLLESLSVTKPYQSADGNWNIKVGCIGYDRKGVPNPLKAAVLEHGRSNQPAKPWAKPAGRKAKKECIKKMQEALDSEVEKL